ncbi:DUF421 domain-containing protein [Altererythrobacter sp. KTW20L]|uniref:DUF421 domain-containing protein n=1 Tax=Altererythrobacter sp. KTW20L TaxID=2942210 RepID=UPI0020C060B6|nr:YetF domain-containing protein [Altererythrobacter sp. KTW20L]MCL6251345.1 DUF421 domain-containing protein [Altererythrobacter sp. KTW20L]
MWFDNWSDLWRILVITPATYAALILILRSAGKRSLAKLNIFDLVVTVALGSTLATIMLSTDVSYAEGALAFVVLCGLQWLVAWLSVRLGWFKQVIRSNPRLVLRDGDFLRDAMRDERVTEGEVLAAVRKKGHGELAGIAAVVLETDGEFSVITGGKASECSTLRGVEGTEPR